MSVIYLKQDTDHHLWKLQKSKSPRSYTSYIIFPISSTFAGVVFVTLEYDEVLGGKNKVYILQYLQWVPRNFEKTFVHTVVNLLIGFQTTLNFIF